MLYSRALGTPLIGLIALTLGTLSISGCSRAQGAADHGAPLTASAMPSATTPAAPTSGSADPNVYVSLARLAMPAVVNISTLTYAKNAVAGSPEELFQYFFGGPGGGGNPWASPHPRLHPSPGPGNGPHGAPRAAALGTGFVIDPSGVILTNNHVVADADEIKISFTENPREKALEGKVIGRDPELDIALIRVKPEHPVTPLALGDSDVLQIGEYVAAIGNPFGQGHSISHGIISQKGRPAPDFPLATYIQTDAPINPGNSGGPLLNLRGEVVGINDAIDPRGQGIGFAIPINLVKRELDSLQSHGRVARGFLGVMVGDLTPELAEKIRAGRDTEAPVVTQVEPNSPAQEAGIKPYDVLLAVNGSPVHSAGELTAAVAGLPAGEKVAVKISRDGKESSISVKLGKRPQPQEVSRADFGGGPQPQQNND